MNTLLITLIAATLFAGNTKEAEVTNPQVPVIIDRAYNVVSEICITSDGKGETLDYVDFAFDKLPAKAVKSVRLVQSGTMSCIASRSKSNGMSAGTGRWGGGNEIWHHPGYVNEVVSLKGTAPSLRLNANVPLVCGKNYFYVSLEIDSKKLSANGFKLSDKFEANVTKVSVSGNELTLNVQGNATRRLGVSVRTHGDDGVDSYRIPGLVTTNNGTLVAVYDIRRQFSHDLQDNVDIGISRSTDGGLTWGKMITAMDMGKYGGLPEAQNGIGDPAILVDTNTGDLLIAAAWTHGFGNATAWWASGDGMEPIRTPQLMISRSKDDGKTWSEPYNITEQIKRPEWCFTFEGPGRGFTMSDGTLVFAFQHQQDSSRLTHAGIMYSRDHGVTWQTHEGAKSNTTESQAVELSDGSIMLNMRDNRKTGRAVYITKDMGKTWEPHVSDAALIEPVCMASLIRVKDDILLFSNPASKTKRANMTIKCSTDSGKTWPEENSILLDEETGWGYSCLTMIDDETVGIIYEGSQAQLVFQAVKLSELLK